jgi:hypothetical protein
VHLSKEASDYLDKSVKGLQPLIVSVDQLPTVLARIDTFIEKNSDLQLCVREPLRRKTCESNTDKYGYDFIISPIGDSLKIEGRCLSLLNWSGMEVINGIIARYYLLTGELPPPGLVPKSESEARQGALWKD